MKRRVRKVDDESPASGRDGRASRFASLSSVAKEFGSFAPASEVLVNVRAVPTIFPDFDLSTRVGGLPVERFTLLHGASGGGKTYFGIGLMLSFLILDHPVFFIDAERTTPIAWLKKAMGEYAEHPFFRARKPNTYEETRKEVREFCNKVKRLRSEGKVHADTTGLIFLDSIRKLVPKDQFDMISRETPRAGQKEQARSRIDQHKAAMNAAWMDEVIPLLDETGVAMVAIARETVDPNVTDQRAIAKGYNKKTGGGSALYYDASLDLASRLVKAYGKKVKGPDGTDRTLPYGDLHEIAITKSKVSGKGEVYRARANFRISNGVWTPAGFDRARDVLDVARRFDVVTGTGWLSYGKKRWRSEDVAVKALAEDPELFAQLDAETRSHFKTEETRA